MLHYPDGMEREGSREPEGGARAAWTFLTNHSHVLICIARDPDIRGRDLAAQVGITERAALSIVGDLVAGGYVTRTRIGRRNRYEIHADLPLRHPIEGQHRVAELLELVGWSSSPVTGAP